MPDDVEHEIRAFAPPRTSRLLLDVLEVATALGCGKTYIYELIGRGELPVVKLGRLTRIPASSVEALVARRLGDRMAMDVVTATSYTAPPTNLWGPQRGARRNGRRCVTARAARSEEG
jgi:excisionase family DNA binding protein